MENGRSQTEGSSLLHPKIESWFRRKKWQPFPFQREAWSAFAEGYHGLINAPTGMGKTYSAWMGPLNLWMQENSETETYTSANPAPPFVLWITPLRALANDTLKSLQAPVEALKLPWTCELRTGDTSQSRKTKQRHRLPTVLVTTPESLSVLLSYDNTEAMLSSLRCVIVDEWHELIGTKRGSQTELCLAWLRRRIPDLRTWGLSATLKNLDLAMKVLTGPETKKTKLVRAENPKNIIIETLMPENIERFPWSGHIGLKLLHPVIERISAAKTTLLFTNTRAQSELWFQSIEAAAPPWVKKMSLHHGSIDREIRTETEEGLRSGKLKCVVCTSSLDLGVDFPTVDQVIQIGSPKGIARLLQRAGRSGHQPGKDSRILCVPTNSFELIEYAATRDAIESKTIEPRDPIMQPIDVLTQHLVTLSMGTGFDEEKTYEEIRDTWAFHDLTPEIYDWVLDFISKGGSSLGAYSQFRKVQKEDGIFKVASPQIARLHRLNIGTIVSDATITLKLQGGGYLGSVEESFIAKLKPSDRFIFAGRVLELVRMKELTAFVRFAANPKGVIPGWSGSRMPITGELGQAVRRRIDMAGQGIFGEPEMEKIRPILSLQNRWSTLPSENELLIETVRSREGYHVYIFPFEGHFVHEGIASLLAWRISQRLPRTIGVTVNDYGMELLSHESIDFDRDEKIWRELLSTDNLTNDLLEGINAAELSRRQFREIARISGLIFSGYPGANKSLRQVQSSSGLLYEVFTRYDPENLLLVQAKREVLDRQMEVSRLRDTLERVAEEKIVFRKCTRFTPMAFPLWASRMSSSRAEVSSEPFGERIQRMVLQLETMADDEDDEGQRN